MVRGTPGLHPAWTDKQRDVPLCHCTRCGGEVYKGECVYKWGGGDFCPECFRGEMDRWLNEAAAEVAWALGAEVCLLGGGGPR